MNPTLLTLIYLLMAFFIGKFIGKYLVSPILINYKLKKAEKLVNEITSDFEEVVNEKINNEDPGLHELLTKDFLSNHTPWNDLFEMENAIEVKFEEDLDRALSEHELAHVDKVISEQTQFENFAEMIVMANTTDLLSELVKLRPKK